MIDLQFRETYNLSATFECGQIFRFDSVDNGSSYIGPLSDRIIKITAKSPHHLQITSSSDMKLNEKIHHFLRVHDNYQAMQSAIAINPQMKEVLLFSSGLHLLQQDPFECTISYILSQCSNIPRIKLHLTDLARRYGQSVTFEDKVYNLFPQPEDLQHLNELAFRDLRCGYRAKYLVHCIKHFSELMDCVKSSPDSVYDLLSTFEGIGPKVAACIALFAFGDLHQFPVDRWIERFMQQVFKTPNGTSIHKLQQLGSQLFGEWAGYAQEFIYNYIRHSNYLY